MAQSPIPTVNVLPPMSPAVRDFLYGLLAWAAGLVTLATFVLAAVPEFALPTWFVAVNAGINGAWTLLGFVAKDNVPEGGDTPDTDDGDYEGRHEA